MKPKSCLRFRSGSGLALVATGLLLMTSHVQAALTHRYSFDNAVTDSIAGANGTLKGDVQVADGSAIFPGVVNTDYIELPSGLISNYTSVTFEFWVNVGENGTWTEIFGFGNQTAGGEGANMLMFCPRSGSTPNDFRMSYAQAAPGYNDEKVVNGVGVLDSIGPVSVACVYDPPNNAMTLYTNGTLVATLSPVTTGAKGFSLTNVVNVNSWLGRSLYNNDAPYNGSIDEFRIYNAPLSPLQVYANNKAGPGTLVTNIAINSLSWNVSPNMVVGSRQSSTVTFNTAAYGSVTLPGATEPTYASSDAKIISVTAQGQLFALAVGSTTVSAIYNGTTNNVTVTVSAPVLAHRYSFATDASDSVGSANGTLVGGATIVGGQASLPGGVASSDTTAAYVDLPNNLLTNFTTVTFEAWATDNDSGAWARVWDFGTSTDGENAPNTGVRFAYITTANGGGNVQATIHVNDRGGEASVITARPATGQEMHLVWTSDTANHSSSLYVNGGLVGINKATTVSPADLGLTLNNWLGRSQYASDPTFAGTINEFRIYNGALSPLQVALDAATGPGQIVTDPGALQSLRVTLATNVVYGGPTVAATVRADFANATNVNVTAAGIDYQTSDANIFTVDASGVVTGTGTGDATLTAGFQGKTATVAFVVQSLAPASLIHRYSFSETAGTTTVKDSVGTANGVLAGTGAVFGGGQITLPGGTSSAADPVAGYVDLPNHIINVLTDVSIEVWTTWQGSGAWQRIFDFGTSAGGEDVSNGNGGYLFLAPQGASFLAFSARDPVAGNEPSPLIGTAPLNTNQEVFLAVVYDHVNNSSKLYSNSVLVTSGTATVDLSTIDDVNNWLGRSQWDDAMFNGKINEFRIWNGVLLPNQIATHYAAGPDSLEAVAQPKLSATLTGQNLVIAWPASATGFVLQSSAQLGTSAAWTAVTGTPTTANGVSSVTIPIGTGTQFYRLRQ